MKNHAYINYVSGGPYFIIDNKIYFASQRLGEKPEIKEMMPIFGDMILVLDYNGGLLKHGNQKLVCDWIKDFTDQLHKERLFKKFSDLILIFSFEANVESVDALNNFIRNNGTQDVFKNCVGFNKITLSDYAYE